ncbi:MAG: hypothetical protein QW514_09320 [Thermoprotei archaeon]
MSQKYIPSINYGSRSKTLSRKMSLLKYVGRDITLHYEDGRTDKLKVYSYEGPYLLLIAPKSSLGHIGIQIDKWIIREEKGELHAYPNGYIRDGSIAPQSSQSPPAASSTPQPSPSPQQTL